MTTGEILRELRRKEGDPPQAEMAWKVFGRELSKDAAASKWSRLENDKQEMSLGELQAICRYFRLPVSHFIQGEVVAACRIGEITGREKADFIHEQICSIYESNNHRIIGAFEASLEGCSEMVSRGKDIKEMKELLFRIAEDNDNFHMRLDNLESLVKSETPALNPEGEEATSEADASYTTFGDAWYAEKKKQ